MASPQLVKEWLEKAEEDFQFAVSVLEESIFYGQICFHFHQAAEKFLKAFIVAHDLEFLKVNDLSILLDLCAQVRPELKNIKAECRFLNPFYIESRYPVSWPTKYSKEEALKARSSCESIRNFILKCLNPHINIQ